MIVIFAQLEGKGLVELLDMLTKAYIKNVKETI